MNPNFFIVGGAKCATTNISYYLNDHPDIFIPELNEPYYYCKFDFLKFLKDFNHEFAFDGGFVDIDIDENQMKIFLENYNTPLLNLTDAHIKKINQHKDHLHIVKN